MDTFAQDDDTSHILYGFGGDNTNDKQAEMASMFLYTFNIV